jgi:hypothetical protein
MWLILTYNPTSLFSLRYSSATAAGAKSLVVPTPYTIKMALLVAAIRWRGLDYARNEAFPKVRDIRPIRIRPAEYAVVNRCFLKYQKLREDKTAKAGREADYLPPIGYLSTVGFREYVYLRGYWDIGLPVDAADDAVLLSSLAVRVNYFGKRGSFVQFLGSEVAAELPAGFSSPLADSFSTGAQGILQPLDDMAPSLTFDEVDVTTDSRLSEAHRPRTPTVLPYRLMASANGYAAYGRFADEGG